MKHLMAGAWMAIAACGALAQTAPPPAFEVASVKLNDSGSGHASTNNATGLIRMTNIPLRLYLQMAFDLRGYQIAGPGWLRSERYDIFAKTDPNATKDQINAMMRTLLVERFGLKEHRETKVLPLYELMTAKGGPKLTASTAASSFTNQTRRSITATRMTMAQLAELLSGQLELPVVDQTGVAGYYDFELKFDPDIQAAGAGTAAPTIFEAMPDQLGLRLKAGKKPLEQMVIDHIDRLPVAN